MVQAQQASISISTGGNNNSTSIFEVQCFSSGTACRVVGNRDNHAGPRSCSISCPIDELVIFSCDSNSDTRFIDEINVPSGAIQVVNEIDREIYTWLVTGSASAGCVYTD